jgi:hypothetical protein
VIDAAMYPTADFGRRNVQKGNAPHQNRLPFSLPTGRQVCSFRRLSRCKSGGKQKKVECSQATNSTEHSEEQRSEVEGGLFSLVFIGFRTLTLAMEIEKKDFKRVPIKSVTRFLWDRRLLVVLLFYLPLLVQSSNLLNYKELVCFY